MVELASDMTICKTEKWSQTHEAMAVYLRDIRTEMNVLTLFIFLMIDRGRSQKNDILSPMYADPHIKVIWLSPYSTHFLHPLDLVMFSWMMMEYYDQPAIKTKPRW
jgi:hypothetical protein